MLGVLQAAVGAVPQTLSYQGILTDGTGTPVQGAKAITISLYTANTGGSPFWTETQSLTLVDGRLSVVLGADPAKPLDRSRFTGETWIGIKVGNDTEMPRQKFSSVAYAFQAGDGGVPKGGIIMWSGAVDAVPAGWALCNGQNGTPDLRDRFVIGAGLGYSPGTTGGVATNNIAHSHGLSAESPGTTSAGDHQHPVNLTTGAATHNMVSPDNGHAGWATLIDHTHNINGFTDWVGGHTHTVNLHSHGGATATAGNSTLDNRPPFYALAYIMKL